MLRRVLRSVPIDLLDKRSAIGVAARKRRQELIDQYGGADAVSTAQLILIESAVKTELIVRAAEDYILRQDTLIRDHALIPVVMQRQQLADSLARTLGQLGLQRRGVDGGDATRALLEVKRLREEATEPAPAALHSALANVPLAEGPLTHPTNPTNPTTEEKSIDCVRGESPETVVGSKK